MVVEVSLFQMLWLSALLVPRPKLSCSCILLPYLHLSQRGVLVSDPCWYLQLGFNYQFLVPMRCCRGVWCYYNVFFGSPTLKLIWSTPPVQAQHQHFNDSKISKQRAMVGLEIDHHLYQRKPKISVTHESDWPLWPINFYIRNCVPPAARKGIQHKKSELWNPQCY